MSLNHESDWLHGLISPKSWAVQKKLCTQFDRIIFWGESLIHLIRSSKNMRTATISYPCASFDWFDDLIAFYFLCVIHCDLNYIHICWFFDTVNSGLRESYCLFLFYFSFHFISFQNMKINWNDSPNQLTSVIVIVNCLCPVLIWFSCLNKYYSVNFS